MPLNINDDISFRIYYSILFVYPYNRITISEVTYCIINTRNDFIPCCIDKTIFAILAYFCTTVNKVSNTNILFNIYDEVAIFIYLSLSVTNFYST